MTHCNTNNVLEKIMGFLTYVAPEIHAFWKSGRKTPWDANTFLAHADYIYSLILMGNESHLLSEPASRFATAVENAPLTGRIEYNQRFGPHLSAYILGALNLLANKGHDYRTSVLSAIKLNLDLLIDRDTQLPRWPRLWAHHIWRVSHWLGGIPSILLSFARHAPQKTISEGFINAILDACDKYILSDETGLMRPYRSDFLQKIFRMTYKLRHNPNHGDIGGLVHIHWTNHATGRPYIAASKLIDRCLIDLKKRPFLENSPYCLDFDYIQLLRTSIEQQPATQREGAVSRAEDYISDIVIFLSKIPAHGYSLHKLPGALAVLHEATLLLRADIVPGLRCKPIDVIKTAYWL
jgi:hypothetical protein